MGYPNAVYSVAAGVGLGLLVDPGLGAWVKGGAVIAALLFRLLLWQSDLRLTRAAGDTKNYWAWWQQQGGPGIAWMGPIGRLLMVLSQMSLVALLVHSMMWAGPPGSRALIWLLSVFAILSLGACRQRPWLAIPAVMALGLIDWWPRIMPSQAFPSHVIALPVVALWLVIGTSSRWWLEPRPTTLSLLALSGGGFGLASSLFLGHPSPWVIRTGLLLAMVAIALTMRPSLEQVREKMPDTPWMAVSILAMALIPIPVLGGLWVWTALWQCAGPVLMWGVLYRRRRTMYRPRALWAFIGVSGLLGAIAWWVFQIVVTDFWPLVVGWSTWTVAIALVVAYRRHHWPFRLLGYPEDEW